MTEQTILLVEDNDDDVELTIRAFKQAQIKNPIVRAKDGVDALDYLLAQNAYAGRDWRDTPAIVFLDLNLPRLSGLELLREIRSDERIAHLPVVVLTSSKEERDRFTAYQHHANSYVRKPVDYDQFVAASKELGMYWLLLNEPPPRRV